MCQTSTSGLLLARAQVQVLQNSGQCYDLHLFQRKIATDAIQEKKNYRERSNIKSARASALMGSVPRKMAMGEAEGLSTDQDPHYVRPTLTTKP